MMNNKNPLRKNHLSKRYFHVACLLFLLARYIKEFNTQKQYFFISPCALLCIVCIIHKMFWVMHFGLYKSRLCSKKNYKEPKGPKLKL